MDPVRHFVGCICVFVLSAQLCNATEQLTVGTWGGPYEAAQDVALFQPFTESTGIEINTTRYTGGLDILDSVEQPDILDMLEEDAIVACESGKLLPLPDSYLETITAETRNDFIDGAITKCAVAHSTFSTIVAFDERAFPDEKPSQIQDFFNIEKFPGKRAVQKDPAALFEWALMAEGVPISQIYDLLSTERGMQLALKRMDSVREHLIWWSSPEESVELLKKQIVVMSSGYNGRFFDARARNVPLNLIWDGQIIDRSVWAAPAQRSKSFPTALTFIRFVTQAKRMGNIAELIPYGPTRNSAFDYIGRHPEYGMNMVPQLPTAPRHLGVSLIRDTRWYARTTEFRHSNFEQWLAR